MITGTDDQLPQAPSIVPSVPVQDDTSPDPIELRCEWCFRYHLGVNCWAIQEIEFHENGGVKRLVLQPRPEVLAGSLTELPPETTDVPTVQ